MQCSTQCRCDDCHFTATVMTNVAGDSATQHVGEDYTLTCTVSGGETTATTTYQWLRDNSPLSGETSATLSFTPLRQTTPSSNGQYVCEAMRSGRTVRSDSFAIDVTGKSDLDILLVMLYDSSASGAS